MERLTKTRTIAILLLFALVLGLYSMTMYGKQIRDADPAAQAGATNTTYSRVRAARGDLLDRNGNLLVSNRASFDLVFDNYVFLNGDSPNESLRRLVQKCEETGLTYNEHFPVTSEKPYEYTLDSYSSAWNGYFRDFLNNRSMDSDISASHLLRELRSAYHLPDDWTDEEVRKVVGLRYEIELRSGVTNLPSYIFINDISASDLSQVLETNTPGLRVESSTVREYNTSHAAHLLGIVAPMDEAQYEKFKDNPDYAMDAEVGISGLELAFEEYLHGVDGVKCTKVDADGNIIEEYYVTPPQVGNNVETSIDLELQIAAENLLENHILNLRENGVSEDSDEGKDAKGGAIVVMNAKTGEVLACASYPTYDPSTYHEKYNELLEADYDPLFDRALLATYAPGSIFKMSMAIAGMETGVIDRHTPITDQGVYTKYIDSGFAPQCLIYTNHGTTHGTIDVEEALCVSCNYFFYQIGDDMGIEAIDRVAKGLGLGEYTGIEVPEAKGQRANPETKAATFTSGIDHEWYAADTVTASIGQSEHRFTPLQMCAYAVTLANQGVRYRATLLSRVVSPDYSTLIEESTPEVLSTYDIPDNTYEAYVAGMHMCAQGATRNGNYGTAYSVFGDYPMNVCVKTGTAQHGEGGSANVSLVAFAPMEDPEIAISIFVERGASTAGISQIAKELMDVYFNQTTSDERLPQEGGLD